MCFLWDLRTGDSLSVVSLLKLAASTTHIRCLPFLTWSPVGMPQALGPDGRAGLGGGLSHLPSMVLHLVLLFGDSH